MLQLWSGGALTPTPGRSLTKACVKDWTMLSGFVRSDLYHVSDRNRQCYGFSGTYVTGMSARYIGAAARMATPEGFTLYESISTTMNVIRPRYNLHAIFGSYALRLSLLVVGHDVFDDL
jgi:hypothetical protein